ncbi:hypothetical protein D3C71_2193900 [compost metagenome]
MGDHVDGDIRIIGVVCKPNRCTDPLRPHLVDLLHGHVQSVQHENEIGTLLACFAREILHRRQDNKLAYQSL